MAVKRTKAIPKKRPVAKKPRKQPPSPPTISEMRDRLLANISGVDRQAYYSARAKILFMSHDEIRDAYEALN